MQADPDEIMIYNATHYNESKIVPDWEGARVDEAEDANKWIFKKDHSEQQR